MNNDQIPIINEHTYTHHTSGNNMRVFVLEDELDNYNSERMTNMRSSVNFLFLQHSSILLCITFYYYYHMQIEHAKQNF